MFEPGPISGPAALIIMGVSGSGKSTLGQALAERLGYRFIEGDALHPAANVAKMASGIPLNDADREPWLELVARELAVAALDRGGVAACSALKLRYRDALREGLLSRGLAPPVFIHPIMQADALLARLSAREGHYMPASLLDSQFATLEVPQESEQVISIRADLPKDDQVQEIIEALAKRD